MPISPLANYLRAHRKRSALSQDELAFLLGCNGSARISRYERGKQTPHLRLVLGYELLFRTPVRELYGGEAVKVKDNLRKRAKILIRRLKKAGVNSLNCRKLEVLRAFIEDETTVYKAA